MGPQPTGQGGEYQEKLRLETSWELEHTGTAVFGEEFNLTPSIDTWKNSQNTTVQDTIRRAMVKWIARPHPSCVAFFKLLNLSGHQYPHL